MAASEANEGAASWRAPLNRLEFATIRVHDLDIALEWYTRALDLQVVDKNQDLALLTCGGDHHVDLALRLDTQGTGRGLESYSFGIDGTQSLENLAATLRARGTEVKRVSVDLPAIDDAIRVETPTGVAFQIVASDERPTGVRNTARDQGVAPIDTDHMNLLAPDVKGYADWLGTTFGFATSDAVEGPDGWGAAWTHITAQHHDVAIMATDDPSTRLHHVAFLAEDLNHMGEIADRICSRGVDRCEWGIGKHGGLGANNFLYVKDPSNNRVEINSNMDENPFERPVEIYSADRFEKFISVWNFQPPPPGFELGS
ncbi:VOC family protein [Sciscionella marina]|uniref:VOC family protein n=1 Tax=Sciscionella marina TaxID=508770 RepID=UPI00037A93D2|nr:VOC family protein [Sciscionella marina]